ncbi:MAG: hypothetical protein ACRCY4_03540 [Brevinema sp.]
MKQLFVFLVLSLGACSLSESSIAVEGVEVGEGYESSLEQEVFSQSRAMGGKTLIIKDQISYYLTANKSYFVVFPVVQQNGQYYLTRANGTAFTKYNLNDLWREASRNYKRGFIGEVAHFFLRNSQTTTITLPPGVSEFVIIAMDPWYTGTKGRYTVGAAFPTPIPQEFVSTFPNVKGNWGLQYFKTSVDYYTNSFVLTGYYHFYIFSHSFTATLVPNR